MRIVFNASGLSNLAKLTARFSFLGASHSENSPPNPAPSSPAPGTSEPSTLDHILPMSGRVRHLVNKGQACGFFTGDIETAQNILVESSDRQFDCAIISIAGAKEQKLNTHPTLSLRIFKERGAETYFVRSSTSGEFSPTGKPLNDAQLYWKLFRWGKACGDVYPSIRIAFMDTMSDKPVPAIYAVKRFAHSLIEQLGTSLSRGFY